MLGSTSRTRRHPPVYLERNCSPFPTAIATPGGALRSLFLASAWFWLAVANAQPFVAQQSQEVDDEPGHFEVLSARAQLVGGVYFLDASISYELSTEARRALDSGVPLSFRLDVELIHPRRWWFDNEDANLRQRYQLEYHLLSERYIVINVNSGDQTSFASLSAALSFLGRVEHLPLIDAAVLDEGRDYDLRLRAVLDVEQLPGPLRLLAFWRRDWSLSSGWYRWQLANE